MCNLSETIEATGFGKGIKKGIEKGIEKGIAEGITKEKLSAIERMIKADATKEQILSYGYTEAEYVEAESSLFVNP